MSEHPSHWNMRQGTSLKLHWKTSTLQFFFYLSGELFLGHPDQVIIGLTLDTLNILPTHFNWTLGGAPCLFHDSRISSASSTSSVIFFKTGCYNFKQLSDNCLYLCSVLGKLSTVYSCLLGSGFNLSSFWVPLGSGIVRKVWEWSCAVNKLSSSYWTWLVTTCLYT